MDYWDLWGPPCDLVTGGCEFYPLHKWKYDFFFGPGRDVLEEQALNEESCIHVLRILIKKADTEIDELEQDLISLQNELAWMENEQWSEISCNALREKINSLDSSLRTLRNKDKNDMEVHLLLHTQPFESLHEILKALHGNYFNKKEEQCKDVKDAVISESSRDSLRHPSNILDGNTNLSIFYSQSIMNAALKELTATMELTPTIESSRSSNLALKLDRRKTYSSKSIKPSNTNVKDSLPRSMKLVAGHSDEKKLSCNFCAKHIPKGEAREHGLTLTDKRVRKSSSKNLDKWRHGVEMAKFQPANPTVKDFSLSVSSHSSRQSSEMKIFSNAHVEVTRDNEVGEDHSRDAGKCKTLLSSSNPQCKRNKPRTDKITGALKCATNLYNREENSDNNTSKLEKGSNLDIEQKLCELAPKAARKRIMKGRKIDGTVNIVSSSSTLKTGETATCPLQIVKAGGSGLTDTLTSLSELQDQKGNYVATLPADDEGKQTPVTLTSLSELQDQKGNYVAKLPVDDEGKQTPDTRMDKIDVDKKISNLNTSSNPRKGKAIRNTNPQILEAIGCHTLEVDPSLSSIPGSKKQKKHGINTLNTGLEPSLSENIMKEIVLPGKCETKEHDALPANSPSSFAQPEKKRKKSAKFPLTTKAKGPNSQVGFSDSHRDPQFVVPVESCEVNT